MIPVTCGDYARVLFTFAREAAGALGTGIPCALYFLGERFLQDSGASRREIAESWLTSLRGAKRRSNPLFFSATHGLLRFARNDDPNRLGCLKSEVDICEAARGDPAWMDSTCLFILTWLHPSRRPRRGLLRMRS